MIPWLLCLLATPSSHKIHRSVVAEELPSNRVWWNPVGTSISRDLEGFEIHEGDILISTAATSDNLKNAIKSEKYLWDDGVIPYEFGDSFSSDEEHKIMDAMKILEEKSCVRFVKKEKEETFIRFQKDKNGCFAPIGRLPGNDGPLPVNLQSPECFKELGIIEHELLHVIGLFHEQARPDRDEYVTVHWCNIDPYHRSDFRKGRNSEMNTFGIPYDFGSIMHYPKWAFSINGQPTITSKANPNMTLGQRIYPSDSDFTKVVKMYKCDEIKLE